MLANLCDYQQNVALIENSGVQFLDFGLTPQEPLHGGRFVRKTANGPLLRSTTWPPAINTRSLPATAAWQKW